VERSRTGVAASATDGSGRPVTRVPAGPSKLRIAVAEDPLDQLDYYDLLRIEESATADQVRRAFHDFAMRYHPDRYAGAEDEKRERAAAIYRRGAEGYRVLTDPEQRRRYDEGLTKGRIRYEEPSSSPGASVRPASGVVDVKNLRARPFVQKALEMIKAGDYKGAKLNLALALNYEPENAPLLAKLEEVKQKLAAR
jgi:curved DNA-binding protein CbpA